MTLILDPGLTLTLRPMKYPIFFEMYKAAIKNTWSVEEVNFLTDTADLMTMPQAERYLVQRLVAFFATGDSIVSNNLVLNLYKHINSPEARLYLSRQLFEEAQHVEFYLLLLDTYISDDDQRAEAFAAIENIPSIKRKGDFCLRWLNSVYNLERTETKEQRRQFLLNLICFAACVEGMFFFGAFAYVYFLRSRGLLHGLADGTNWVFRDESMHMAFAFQVVKTIRQQEPDLFDNDLAQQVYDMLEDAIQCEMVFAEDVLSGGIAGLSMADMRQYLEYCADQRLVTLGLPPRYGARMPFDFLNLQDVQELANFFERTVSGYQSGVKGDVDLGMSF